MKPDTVSLGTRYETRQDIDHLVYDTFQNYLETETSLPSSFSFDYTAGWAFAGYEL